MDDVPRAYDPRHGVAMIETVVLYLVVGAICAIGCLAQLIEDIRELRRYQ